MSITTRERGYNRSRSTFGGFSGFGFGTGGGTYGRTTTAARTRKNTTGGTGYKTVCNTCEQKINSYRTLWNQAKGPANAKTPSPTTLNSFCNWINKGAVVQCCTPAQVSRWARATKKNFNPINPTPTACKSILTAKFGKNAIKAVARTKSGQFMVVTTPTINGKTFTFPR